VTNRRHERVFLDAVAKHLLPHVDGAHDRDALLDQLTALVVDGMLVLKDGDDAVVDAVRARALLQPELEVRLMLFGRQALLVG
jgi:methyltransferase-like protein